MARLVGVDIPDNKRALVALTYIYGIGRTSSEKILKIYEHGDHNSIFFANQEEYLSDVADFLRSFDA